jgi:hypothetical protein
MDPLLLISSYANHSSKYEIVNYNWIKINVGKSVFTIIILWIKLVFAAVFSGDVAFIIERNTWQDIDVIRAEVYLHVKTLAIWHT